jgi:hypothetical protein
MTIFSELPGDSLKDRVRAHCRAFINVCVCQQVEAMIDEGIYRMDRYVEGGWITGLKYEDEIIADLEKRTESKPNKLKIVSCGLRKAC